MTLQPVPPQAIWVVIPAYNEERSVAAVVRGVLCCGYRVVVVDDASVDQTYVAAQQSGALVLRHPINLGQGAALQTGIAYALAAGADVIVSFDADGQHNSADIAVLVDALAQHRADVAFGSRFLGQAVDMRAARGLLLRLAAWLGRALSGMAIKDTQNGMRAFTRHAATAIRIRQNRFAHAYEIIMQVGSLGLRYVEVPTTVTYSDYSRSKGQTAWSSLTILLDLILGKLRQW